MPCRVRSTSKTRHRHKQPPSLLRQIRFLERLSACGLRIALATPSKPSTSGDDHGQGAR